VKRRDFIAGLGNAAACSTVAAWRQHAAMPVIGYLRSGSKPLISADEVIA
jgi:hypothetical protein